MLCNLEDAPTVGRLVGWWCILHSLVAASRAIKPMLLLTPTSSSLLCIVTSYVA